MLPLMALLMLSFQTSAGEKVDADGDGLFCVMEDGENDGDAPIKFCGEDDQDKCDGIPNVSRDDDNCSVDLNGDGRFTLLDFSISRAKNDHLLSGFDYNWYNSFPENNRDYLYYEQFNMDPPVYPFSFGGNICFYPMRVIEYNKRLTAAGLPLLQTKPDGTVDFLVAQPGWHCFQPAGHHSYPEIR